MDIGIFGATGVIGRAAVAEALERGHRVTAFTRDEARIPTASGEVTWRVADPADLPSARAAIAGLDVVLNTISPGSDIADQIAHADVLPAVARTLLTALQDRPATRLLVVGGGGSLELAPGRRFIDDPALDRTVAEVLKVPAEYSKVILAQAEVLKLCRLSDRNWTYLSPSAARIAPGTRTGHYRIGGDQMIQKPEGESGISAEDLAVALLDEVEIPRYIQRRFTVG
ncbi:NAD(P)-dependent oxidoreductase [Streptomyces sp. GbtcB6]|uniref:NAD(P)-dependent oxidoreductase n=1 Tax=Streptomyces sp. GbtcB6 TaxID=2824751 RepID=UPI001C2FD8FD|nr:NAD(P)H-binding protein [Streptomyces sp. GbtcB6]